MEKQRERKKENKLEKQRDAETAKIESCLKSTCQKK